MTEDYERVFFSFRMYLNNPQHLRIAKALKKIGDDRLKNTSKMTKNQFVADAIDYYLNNYVEAEKGEAAVTQKQLEKMKKEIKEELREELRGELLRFYNPYMMPGMMQMQQMPQKTRKEEIDETIRELIADWD